MNELADQLGTELDAEITDLVRLSAGASRETWSFAADGEPLVLQRSRFAAGLGAGVDEPALLRHAHAGGVTVPEIVASSTGGEHPLGRQFTISRHLDGESIARKILRDDEYATARERFVADCARELAMIHALDPGPMTDRLPTITDPVAAQRGTYEMLGDPHPVFDLAFRWLDDHRPRAREPRVVHGDFRMGNFLIGPDGVVAVLDWELAHLGDPVEDLGWLVARAWRFRGTGEVGGLGSRDELLDAYARESGVEVSPAELKWWEVLASLRWGVITMFMGDEFRKGSTRSVEQATIGRRVVETEYDVMLLLLPELREAA
ncbi:MAG: phosphotransferase family protein [Acidimicrobiales bacterium]